MEVMACPAASAGDICKAAFIRPPSYYRKTIITAHPLVHTEVNAEPRSACFPGITRADA
jgi:hypothetical protein